MVGVDGMGARMLVEEPVSIPPQEVSISKSSSAGASQGWVLKVRLRWTPGERSEVGCTESAQKG